MSNSKVQSTHWERTAYVYVRQSTVLQVMENRESTERQYNLQERAIQLGWAPSRVEVIDEDQGRSGSTAAHRSGFQHLVSEVGQGRVGIVLMLEASRLARNNSDWYRLIEICGVSGTLIADEAAVYNPREPNDRLLLGMKGTLSEAELFTLRTRLYEGRWNKARKGLWQFPLPTGFVRGAEGGWELDPDTQVQERLRHLFELFRRHGVARRVVRELKQQRLDLPARVMAKEGYGSLAWKAPTLGAVVRILHNPAYAGAYVFGRGDYSGNRRSAKTGKIVPQQGTMAGQAGCASSRLSQLGGILEEPGALASELGSRRRPGSSARRDRLAAGSRLLRILRPEDGDTAWRVEDRQEIAGVYLWTGLPVWRREDMPEHDLAAGGCCGDTGLSGSGLPPELAGRGPRPGSDRERLGRPTPATGVAVGTSPLRSASGTTAV